MGSSCSCIHTTVTQIHFLQANAPSGSSSEDKSGQEMKGDETEGGTCSGKWNLLTGEVKALLDIRPRNNDVDALMNQVNEMLKTDDNLNIESNYENIVKELEKTGELWRDPEFLPEPSSLTYEHMAPEGIEWIRTLDLHENPFFMTDGVSKSDIVQGELGDCWFWASVATIANYRRLTERVIPSGQFITGSSPYYGVFRFRFWQFGKWVEILVDDYLPTRIGQLIYAKSEASNEFWPSLFEKAFAKLHGSYKAIEGGWTLDALTDLTGGVGEIYRFSEYADRYEELYDHLAAASRKNALMACGTGKGDGKSGTQDGLIAGHAYGVTAVRKLTTPRGRVPLVRILNPWGSGKKMEWTGDWSDDSPLWDQIPTWTKESFGFTKKDDGEFWMKFDDFCRKFANITVLTLGPDFDGDGGADAGSLQEVTGQWVAGINAGGSRNNMTKYSCNPQYPITIAERDVHTDFDDDQEDRECSILICLIQNYRRTSRKLGLLMSPIGVQIYRSCDPLKVLTAKHFTHDGEVSDSEAYVAQRSITLRCKLTPGHYVIIPSTFAPETDEAFMLRIFTDAPIQSHQGFNLAEEAVD
ncbi:calpain-A-like isoform X1 [Amblyraja radiata]|uniref:calpain-A-like isoform X1 n=2 Tax=Amblyraja radiata TaxID=386614 RepID=UPI0014039181|nr:calpain-A-like isoform X1 [Amblyraja radiata]